MKKKIYISFNANKNDWAKIYSMLDVAEKKKLIDSELSFMSYHGFTLDEEDPILHRVRLLLIQAKIEWSERIEIKYSAEELKKYPLLTFVVRRAPKGDGGPCHGTKFEMSSACKYCGTGTKQISSLIFRESDIPKKAAIFQTLDFDFIINKSVAKKLEESKITGCELRPLKSKTTGLLLEWFQILPNFELPQFNGSSKGIKRDAPCQQCIRNGYYGDPKLPYELHYDIDKMDINSIPDISHTFEYFGNSYIHEPFEKSHFALPLIIVKPKVMEIFHSLKVKHVEYYPVIFD